MKACKWLPVIIPIKEQLVLAPVGNMAAVLGLPPLHNIQRTSGESVCLNVSMCVCALCNCLFMCVKVGLDMHSALDNFQVQSIPLPASGMYLCSWEILPELLIRVNVCVCT